MRIGSRSLRRRSGRAAFWRISAASLEVALIERCVGEPLVTACAGVEARWIAGGGGPAAGIVELCVALGAARLRHVAALGDEYCVLSTGAVSYAGGSGTAPPRVSVPVVGGEPYVCEADADAVRRVRERFDAAGLRLERLDCAPCARLALTTFLGVPVGDARAGAALMAEGAVGRSPVAASVDPLAAVSVAPECENAAASLATRLTVPVGLALLWFGHVDRLVLGDAVLQTAVAQPCPSDG